MEQKETHLIPLISKENSDARFMSVIKWLASIIVVLVLMLTACNMAWLFFMNQPVSTTITTEQTADNSSENNSTV